ncbi:histidine kinase [Amycolatopsis sp. OK19-0408]|uniref:histidine kinase n=1 Tax=Amycolatopsis iheyensis TaxID=2945988 RepID=A0A9X2SH77_9PSEU|nr:histidine kinase [Amycolatopsis iheyensis]MCR6482452.1 histidine kinase [Amycolatopsis iheyensis]
MTDGLIEPGFRSTWPGAGPLRAWARRHPAPADLLLAFALLFLALMVGAAGAEPGGPWLVVVVVLLLGMLAARRRFPLAVLAATTAVGVAQDLFGPQFPPTTVAVLIAGYTVAAHRDRHRVPAAVATVVALTAGGIGGHTGWAMLAAGLVFSTAIVTAAFALGVNVRTRRAFLASLHDRAVRAERERDQESQIAAARERARIAREMHDIIAHNLSVMIALADGAAFAARTDSAQAEAAAKHVSATGRQALDEMHRLLNVLRGGGEDSPRAPQPGIAGIDEVVDQVRATGLPVTWTVTGRRFPLPPTVELAVYRVAQEALTNVLKHAVAPASAKIHLTYEDPLVTLEVLDDGRPAPAPVTAGGHGLSGMRERASVSGGDVSAGPRPGGGWRVFGRFGSGT